MKTTIESRFSAAIDAFEREDWAAAFEGFRCLHEETGNPDILNYLAIMYEGGYGTRLDLGEARSLYRLGIEQGDLAAVFGLASLERDTGNADEAIRLYRSIIGVDPTAGFNLAKLLVWRLGSDAINEALEILQGVISRVDMLSENDQLNARLWFDRLRSIVAERGD